MTDERIRDLDRLSRALLVLTEWGIPPDVQDVLVAGDPMRRIKPRALLAVLKADEEVARRLETK